MNNDTGIKQTAGESDHFEAALAESTDVAVHAKRRSMLYVIAIGVILIITIMQMSELLKILDALKKIDIGS